MKRIASCAVLSLCVLFVGAVYVQCQALGSLDESNRDRNGQETINASQSQRSSHADKFDEYIKREMAKRNVPGLAFALMKNGQVSREGAYGFANMETGARVGIDSVFELASVTKPITAISVMMLVEQKKLALDDPVNKYLPQVPAAWHEITVRELLSHTSGLREYGLVKCDGSELLDISTKQQFEDLVRSTLLFVPGTGTQYSDSGYFILGMLIESVSGQSYRDFL